MVSTTPNPFTLRQETNLNKNKIVAGALAVVTAASLAACTSTNGNTTEKAQQQKDTTTLVNQQPIPGYNYSQIRQNLIDIENAEANGAQSTSFFFNFGVRDPYMSCPSIGAPIANTTSLSNPFQSNPDNSASVVGQMDPNGVYPPTNSSGTWVLCIGQDGKITPQYAEETVHAVFAPAVWDDATHQIKIIGSASVNFTVKK